MAHRKLVNARDHYTKGGTKLFADNDVHMSHCQEQSEKKKKPMSVNTKRRELKTKRGEGKTVGARRVD